MKEKIIAIAGNPNCGKSTIFNGLTGGKQIIGNWPGVTVERVEGQFKAYDSLIKVVDLPGIYSLSASSEDEKVSRDYLLENEASFVINVVDAANLERNLYLTAQLIEMNIPMIIVLNRIDIAKRHNIEIDSVLLQKQLGVTVIEMNATKESSLKDFKNIVLNEFENVKTPSIQIEYESEVESFIASLAEDLKGVCVKSKADPRWVAIKLFEGDPEINAKIAELEIFDKNHISSEIEKIEKLHHEAADILIADYRYGFIHSIIKSVKRKRTDMKRTTDLIDSIVLNRFLGIPIFLFAMYMVFTVTMKVGGALIDFFDILSGALFVEGSAFLLNAVNSPQWLTVIISSGLGAGLQMVATFVPIIFFMFFMLAILEDSGYMARAAFVADRFMRHIGLPGKSFVPMLVGFGCTVPAIMATRTLESKRDRIMTVFMTPLMSCGARLPVYVIFSAAFFGKNSGTVVFSIYLVGIGLALLTGILLKKTIFRGETSYFIMELPTYNPPRLKHILINTWTRLKVFISQAGKIIVVGVMLLAFINSLGTDFTFGNEGTEKSVLSKVGKTITPVFNPIGIERDNWPASVALFTGVFAKEAVIGTLTSLYSQIEKGDSGEETEEFSFSASIQEAFLSVPTNLAAEFGFSGEEENEGSSAFVLIRKYFDKGKWQAYAYMLFVLIYFPCLAATSTIFREIGYKLGAVAVTYLTVSAWAVSVLFYQMTVEFNLLYFGISAGIILMIYLIFRWAAVFTKSTVSFEEEE